MEPMEIYDPATMTEKDVNRILHELRTLQRRSDELKADIKERHDTLKAYMDAREVEEFIAAGYKVTWKPVKYRTINVSAFAKELPELAELFEVEVTQRRFKIAAAPVDAHH